MGEGLKLRLLGGLQVSRDGRPVTGFISGKAQALVCYLAVTGRSHLRPALATLLWSEMAETEARTNLRMVLTNLRKLLGPYLVITRQAVAFNQESQYWLDVETFSRWAGQAAGSPGSTLTAERLAALQEAANLYQGDFLVGFHVNAAPTFEEWVLGQRERLRELASHTLHTLAAYYAARREAGRAVAIDYTSRLLTLDPWREEAHRQMMLLLARSGRRSAALAQYETCRRILTEELGIEPMVETTTLYHRIRAAGATRPHNLPPQPTPFIGREDELVEITRLLADPACRLLTITGSGGIGKTRLALQAAAAAAVDDFLNGICFVPLAAVSSTELLISAIAGALDFSFYGGEDFKLQLLNYLRPKEMLLVLGNFEQLLEGVGLLIDILQHAPAVKLMVTSRQRLNLRWEWLFEIEGLQYPSGKYLNDLENYSAVQLFLQSARRVNRRFSLSEETRSWVAHICRLLAGMPLGIELAAAWVGEHPCKTIALEIEQSLDFLTTSLRDVPTRHRSLRAVFDHSWQLLSAEERQVFSKLSVFRGSFQPEAAEAVAGGAALCHLSALVDKSLLRQDSSGRYEMHKLLHQYAAEKLQEVPPEQEEMQHRHCRYYAQFLRQREDHLKGGRRQEALAEIGSELENVYTAWQWAVGQERLEAIDQSLESLYYFYETRGRFQEGKELLQGAIASLSGERENSERETSKAEHGTAGKTRRTSGGTEEPRNCVVEERERARILGEILARQGALLDRLGQYGQARALLRKSLSIFDRLGARREMAFSFHYLGYIACMRGEYTEAKKFLEKSLVIYRENGDRWGIASSLNILGDVVIALGAYEEAKQLFQESLAVTEALNTREGIAWADHGLGDVHRLLEELQKAKQYYQQSLAIFEEINAREGMAWAGHGLGDVAMALEEYTAAKQHYRQSLVIFEEMGDRKSVAETLNALGNVARALGRDSYPQAREKFHQALRVAMEIQANPVALRILVGLATVLAAEGEEGVASNRAKKRAVDLLIFILHHSASDKETKDRTVSLLAELEAQPLPQVVATVRATETTRTLGEVVAEILGREPG